MSPRARIILRTARGLLINPATLIPVGGWDSHTPDGRPCPASDPRAVSFGVFAAVARAGIDTITGTAARLEALAEVHTALDTAARALDPTVQTAADYCRQPWRTAGDIQTLVTRALTPPTSEAPWPTPTPGSPTTPSPAATLRLLPPPPKAPVHAVAA